MAGHTNPSYYYTNAVHNKCKMELEEYAKIELSRAAKAPAIIKSLGLEKYFHMTVTGGLKLTHHHCIWAQDGYSLVRPIARVPARIPTCPHTPPARRLHVNRSTDGP